jgi:WD40 repeat protein
VSRIIPLPTRTFDVDWSPDGERVAVCDVNGRVFLLDARRHRVVLRRRPAQSPLIALAWGRDGIATGGVDGFVRVLDPQTLRIERTVAVNRRERSDINGLAWGPDGELAAAAQTGIVYLVRARARPLERRAGWLRAVAWLDRRRVAAGGSLGTLWIWDARSGRVLAAHRVPSSRALWAAGATPDGTVLATGGGDGVVRVWG